MKIETKFNMYDVIKDRVTEYKGKVVGITVWSTGCIVYAMQGLVDKDGAVPKRERIDEVDAVIVESASAPKATKRTGGPHHGSPRKHRG